MNYVACGQTVDIYVDIIPNLVDKYNFVVFCTYINALCHSSCLTDFPTVFFYID